ncbi:MAG: multidrug ABC transporter ATP-binding protein [Rhodospirillaceae bacterium]|nr:multidrug ABC transporter ATP-binding protein [Rhodospirillaceae bacterium]
MKKSNKLTLPDNAIELNNLTKTYFVSDQNSAVRALDCISLKVPRGQIFGLLGPNGAGKSTTINILAGMVIKSGGEAKIWGYDIDHDMRMARSAIGIVPQEVNLDAFFSPYEALEFQAGLYGVPKRERKTMELLGALGLADKAHAYARSLSGGMKRRLLIAKALVHSPPVVVLDEPTAGVDVELRRQLWAYMHELNKEGVTIVLTTHYLEEAQEMCDRIAIIDQGNVVTCENTDDLISQIDQRMLKVTLGSPIKKLEPQLTLMGGSLLSPTCIIFNFSPSEIVAGEIIAALGDQKLEIIDLVTVDSDLEDIFIKVTGLEEKNKIPNNIA